MTGLLADRAPVVAGFAVAVGLGAAVAYLPPLLAVGLIGAIGCLLFPRQVGLVALAGLLLAAPLVNPAVAGSDTGGRLYLSTTLAVLVVLAAIGSVILSRGKTPQAATTVLAAVIGYCAVLYRPGSESLVFWLYRPLQPILLALAVSLLLRNRRGLANRLLRIGLLVGAVGAGLGFINGVIPAFDPFVLSRPADLPYRSALESVAGDTFLRATGAFVYPNVFGLFCAFLIISAVGAAMDRHIGPRIAWVVSGCGVLALLTTGARADLGGMACGVIYLVWVASPGKRIRRLVGTLILGVLLLVGAAQTTTGAAVIRGRLASITGESGQFRLTNSAEGWRTFIENPVIGTGVVVSRLDNGFLLYLSMGGIVGFLLLCAALVLVSQAQLSNGRSGRVPTTSRALLVALASSSLLQDSIGQTLSSYFLGIMLGIFGVLAGVNPEQARSNSRSLSQVVRPRLTNFR